MKSRNIIRTAVLIATVLIFAAMFAVAACAEDILPADDGGATYIDSQLSDGNENAGGAIIIDGDIDIGDNTYIEEPGNENAGGAIIIGGDIDIGDNTYIEEPGNENAGGAIIIDEDIDIGDNTYTDETGNGDMGGAITVTEPEDQSEEKSEETAAVSEEPVEVPEEPGDGNVPEETGAVESDGAEDAEEEGRIEDMEIEPVILKAIPRNEPKDPELMTDKEKFREKMEDAIIKIGESLVPFGSTIVDYFKNGNNPRDVADTVIDVTTDVINFVSPIAGPIASVAKDLLKRFISLF